MNETNLQAYNFLNKLAKDTIENARQDLALFKKILMVGGRNYQLDFKNQILLAVQIPAATQVADIGTWNSFRRYVRKGSTAAKLIDENRTAKYFNVFDISDTLTNSPNTKIQTIEITSETISGVTEYFQQCYGYPEDLSFGKMLKQVSDAYVDFNGEDYIEKIFNMDVSEERFYDAVKTMTSYMVLTRLGRSAERILPEDAFSFFGKIESADELMTYGNVSQKMSLQILSCIDRICAQVRNNEPVVEAEGLDIPFYKPKEDAKENDYGRISEDNIYEDRRLLYTESRGEEENAALEVRQRPSDVAEGTLDEVRYTVASRGAGRIPGSEGQGSERDVREVDEGTYGGGENPGDAQIGESETMVGEDGSREGGSDEDSLRGSSLQEIVNDFLFSPGDKIVVAGKEFYVQESDDNKVVMIPALFDFPSLTEESRDFIVENASAEIAADVLKTEEEQENEIAEMIGEKNVSQVETHFSETFRSDDLERFLLLMPGRNPNAKFRIIEQLKSNNDVADNAVFVFGEYGKGNVSLEDLNVYTDISGVTIERNGGDAHFKWSYVVREIELLINESRYITDAESEMKTDDEPENVSISERSDVQKIYSSFVNSLGERADAGLLALGIDSLDEPAATNEPFSDFVSSDRKIDFLLSADRMIRFLSATAEAYPEERAYAEEIISLIDEQKENAIFAEKKEDEITGNYELMPGYIFHIDGNDYKVTNVDGDKIDCVDAKYSIIKGSFLLSEIAPKLARYRYNDKFLASDNVPDATSSQLGTKLDEPEEESEIIEEAPINTVADISLAVENFRQALTSEDGFTFNPELGLAVFSDEINEKDVEILYNFAEGRVDSICDESLITSRKIELADAENEARGFSEALLNEIIDRYHEDPDLIAGLITDYLSDYSDFNYRDAGRVYWELENAEDESVIERYINEVISVAVSVEGARDDFADIELRLEGARFAKIEERIYGLNAPEIRDFALTAWDESDEERQFTIAESQSARIVVSPTSGKIDIVRADASVDNIVNGTFREVNDFLKVNTPESLLSHVAMERSDIDARDYIGRTFDIRGRIWILDEINDDGIVFVRNRTDFAGVPVETYHWQNPTRNEDLLRLIIEQYGEAPRVIGQENVPDSTSSQLGTKLDEPEEEPEIIEETLPETVSETPENSVDITLSQVGTKFRWSVNCDDYRAEKSDSERLENNKRAVKRLAELEGGAEINEDIAAELEAYSGFDGLRVIPTDILPPVSAAVEKSNRYGDLDPKIISSIYKWAQDSGFRGGKILNIGADKCDFFGAMPDSMRNNSSLFSVSNDTVASKIAKFLYPEVSFDDNDFKSADLPGGYFDFVVGSIPFVRDENPPEFYLENSTYQVNNAMEYSVCKAVSKVRPGGIAAIVVSEAFLGNVSRNGRMTQTTANNSSAARYIYERAEFCGAIRLPDRVCGKAEGAKDIIFLKRRARDIIYTNSAARNTEWLHGGFVYVPQYGRMGFTQGFRMNSWLENRASTNVLGDYYKHDIVNPYGYSDVVLSVDDRSASVPLEERMDKALENVTLGTYKALNSEHVIYEFDEDDSGLYSIVDASENIKPYSFGIFEDKVYYRENEKMKEVLFTQNRALKDENGNFVLDEDGRKKYAKVALSRETNEKKLKLLKKLITLRDAGMDLIAKEEMGVSDEELSILREKLNNVYDDYSNEYGPLCQNKDIKSIFITDSGYSFLMSMEDTDELGRFVDKSTMFYRRAIKHIEVATHLDAANDALNLSMREKNKVDMDYMMDLTGRTENELRTALNGVIFLNPYNVGERYGLAGDSKDKYLTANEYLSGNVRKKLEIARDLASVYPQYEANVAALETVQPVELTSDDIVVTLGSTWIPARYIKDFIEEIFAPSEIRNINVAYVESSGEWIIEGYREDNANATDVYGTEHKNGYDILKDTLNMRDVIVRETIDGETVINHHETLTAQAKQSEMKEMFCSWIWQDAEREYTLCKIYNDRFNSCRPREYDGSYLELPGSNPGITLHKHQKDAITRILSSGNTLLAHAVGAGKTYEMVASAQEGKRLGLHGKALFVVPTHLTHQWASDYLRLYPSAKVLVSTPEDFNPKNRRKFLFRIKNGDWDAVIITHEQLKKMPLSMERQLSYLEGKLNALKEERGERIGTGRIDEQIFRSFNSQIREYENRLSKLYEVGYTNDELCFEKLGIDMLYVDEAHQFKNLPVVTKMGFVSGIQTTQSAKALDLLEKAEYMNETYGERRLVFATGTPISNSMCELYNMQRYLQPQRMRDMHVYDFDSWASTFGNTITTVEIAVDGKRNQLKKRFSRFINVPELRDMFREVADVKTPEMLETTLKVPDVDRVNESLEPSAEQQAVVATFAERAERIKVGVDPRIDNMLKVTTDGRKLALDQRVYDNQMPEGEGNKVERCAENVYSVWNESSAEKSTQLVFCDLSTPNSRITGDGERFCVYDALKDKLIQKGIPENEIAFIHDATDQASREKIFEKVRTAEIRVLIGSTDKMGAGANVQNKLIAIHHLDCPWRPADLQQREGRIVRQGNENERVKIFTYVTQDTFDQFLYQTISRKQSFISEVLSGKSNERIANEPDTTVLEYETIKALCTGDERIRTQMYLQNDVQRLELLYGEYLRQQQAMQKNLTITYPETIAKTQERIELVKDDIATMKANAILKDAEGKDVFSGFKFEFLGINKNCETEEDAIKSLSDVKNLIMISPHDSEMRHIGIYRGFEIETGYDFRESKYVLAIRGKLGYTTSFSVGPDAIKKLDAVIDAIPERLSDYEDRIEQCKDNIEKTKAALDKPFSRADELAEKRGALRQIENEIGFGRDDRYAVANGFDDDEPNEEPRERSRALDADDVYDF